VSADIDQLLDCKTLQELSRLETQVSTKLCSDEPIDVEYWEQLLSSIRVYKAKAELSHIYKSIIDSRLSVLREQQTAEAAIVKKKLALLVTNHAEPPQNPCGSSRLADISSSLSIQPIKYSQRLDPEPYLKLRPEDKVYDVVEESDFLDIIVSMNSF
jgi:hypothetical protein